MTKEYTFSELSELSPSNLEKILEEIKSEYAELLREKHQKCATVLFYQREIEILQR